MLQSFEKCTTLTPYGKNLAVLKPVRIICLTRSLSMIGIADTWLLSLMCLLMRLIASFLRYTGYLNFMKDHVSHVLLLILVHVLILNRIYF